MADEYGFKPRYPPTAPLASTDPAFHIKCEHTSVRSRHCPQCYPSWPPPPGGSSYPPPYYPPPPSGIPSYPPSHQYPPSPPSRPHYPPSYSPPRHKCPICQSVLHGGPGSNCRQCHAVGVGYPTAPSGVQPPRGGTKAYYWVDTFARGSVPSTALHGGHDVDGEEIFVGRAFHEGDWIPAKVIPGRNVAYVAYAGGEHAKDHYQVLCEQRFDWIPSSGGHIPPGAVEGGRTSDGETLYIGRAHHDGSLTIGKIHPSHGVCYIPFGGREIGHHNYEILVLRS